jgi:predicted RND superfamily exporter protein
MLQPISRFCSRFPWLVIMSIIAVTVWLAYQIIDKAYFEADLTKFLPKGLVEIKADDYYRKNFNYKDTMLIGVKVEQGSVLEPRVLRAIEAIVDDLKQLEGQKVFDSRLTGQRETRVQAIGIDPDSVMAIANLEDAILDTETGSVISGSVIAKLKRDVGISSPPGEEARLPADDEDLLKIIPALKDRVLGDRTFSGNLLSTDLHAASIRAAMVRKSDYKRRYAELELATAIDASKMTARFEGRDSTFPFTIYDRIIDGIHIDDAYITDQTTRTRQKLEKWLQRQLKGAQQIDPELDRLLSAPLTADSFQELVRLTGRRDFFDHDQIGTWTDFINDLYDFMLKSIDPFSRENLEFQIHNVYDIFDFAEIYNLTRDILERHSVEGVTFYVAGMPVVIGVITYMMQQDMQRLVPIAVVIVLLVLLISFRSVRGVVIPSLTVILAVIWTLGIMALSGVPFSLATTVLPVILLGIGTAYGIHLLNRYYEDAAIYTDRRKLVQTSVTNVGVAVVMAAVTTIAGFSSLATSKLTALQHFGIFSGVGVAIALVLTITLTPAMLVIWPLPRRQQYRNHQDSNPTSQEGLVLRFMRRWAILVSWAPKTTVFGLGILFVASLLLMSRNYFEGSMMTNFKENNPLYQSDRFINKHLSGTTNINLVFQFRDQISFSDPQTRQAFAQHADAVSTAWERMVSARPELAAGAGVGEELNRIAADLPESIDRLLERIELIDAILNEEYTVTTPTLTATSTSSADMRTGDLDALVDVGTDGGGIDGLEALADNHSASPVGRSTAASATGDPLDDLSGLADNTGSNGLDDLSGLADESPETESIGDADTFGRLSPGQLQGLQELHRRLNTGWDDWQATGRWILALREQKSEPDGIRLQREVNWMKDFLAVDIKQPAVLHKLDGLHQFLTTLEAPAVYFDGVRFGPTGFVMTPVDFVRKFYRVFYHDDDPAFDRLPDVEKDGFSDPTLTDRSIIGVVLNQAFNAGRDEFEAVITADQKEFQVQIMIRNDSHSVIEGYVARAMDEVNRLFPVDDPYIGTVKIGGTAPMGNAVNNLISRSQIQSILLSFCFVFIVTFFIFRSAIGGLFALIPLAFTVILNFGLIALMGGQINMTTMMVASISIGTGVDYTIHFLERLKIQLRAGDTMTEAYINTVMTSGRAILVNASAVALGFLVLIFSIFVPQETMGILMAATMTFSSLGALTLLPAVILIIRPRFLERLRPIENPDNSRPV